MKRAGLETGDLARIAGVLAVFALLLVYVAARFEVTTDVSEFLPAGEDRALSALSRQIADSELSRTMILALETRDLDAALAASRAFEAALRADPRIESGAAFLEGGPSAGLERALFELYEPRRLFFLADDEAAARARTSDDGLRAAAAGLRRELGGPLSLLASRVAPRDPFLSLPAIFRRLERSRAGELAVVDGRFVAADERTAILFLGTSASALDTAAQRPILAAIEDAHRAIEGGIEGGVRLDQSGVNRFALRAATAIEADIQRVSIASTLIVFGVLWLLFRSLRLVVLAAVPVTAGVVAGMAAVLFAFGRLHGITLAFGASLIGVAIDYVEHLYCHHTIASPDADPRATLREIGPSLATGAVTTLAGFAALGFSALSGLREVACFSVVGIIVAYVVTLLVVPLGMPRGERSVALRTWLVERVERGFHRLAEFGPRLVLVPIVLTVFVAAALPAVRFDPELANLGRMDPALLAETERVQSLVGRMEQRQFVVAVGVDEASALAVNDVVAKRLAAATEAGELDGMRSLAPLLPSPATQAAVAAVTIEDPTLPDRLRTVFRAEGYAEGAFEPYLASLAAPLPAPLRYEDLLASPAGALVRPFRVHLGEQVGFLTFLQGVHDADALARRLEGVDGAILLRQAELFRDAQLAYQRSTLSLLGAGLVAVAALVALRYRDLRRTLAALVPSLLAAAVTVSVLGITDRGLDLISLTALLFVVSMGVDYSVFLVDARESETSRSLAAALTSAFVAGFTTVGGFALLALSQHPVLADLGLTASVGIGTSMLLAPTTLVLLRPKERA